MVSVVQTCRLFVLRRCKHKRKKFCLSQAKSYCELKCALRWNLGFLIAYQSACLSVVCKNDRTDYAEDDRTAWIRRIDP